MCNGWSGCIKSGSGMNYLARLRIDKALLASQFVNAARLCELRLRQAQLTIFLAQLLTQLLFRLDTVTAFDGAEVLQPIDHKQR